MITIRNDKRTILRFAVTALAVLLFCGVFCGAAAAAETVTTPDDLTSAVGTENFDVILGANIDLGSSTLSITKKGTLDLNGYVLKSSGQVIMIDGTGDLTLKDSGSTAHYFKFVDNGKWTLETTKPTDASKIHPLSEFNRTAAKAAGAGAYYVKVTGGVITGGSASSQGNGSGVSVGSSGTFTMKGGSITGNSAIYGGGVFNSGTFTMTGGNIIGNSAINDGGGVYVFNNAEFTMTGGNIIGNSAINDGGGVCVVNDGGVCVGNGGEGGGVSKFTMSDGSITGNEATQNGGGVYVESGEFTMSKTASITGNTASMYGGGVCVASGTFTMSETASITGNRADIGGGVYVIGSDANNKGTITMSGGSIKGNTATGAEGANGGGVYVAEFGEFKVSGTPEISGNKKGTGANNVCLPIGRIITVISKLEPGANIGVTNESNDAFARGTDTTAQYSAYTVSVNDAQYFHHDTNAGLAAKVEDPTQSSKNSKLVWETKVTVDFDLQGHGTSIPSVNIGKGSTVPKPTPDPTEVGYTFNGWYNESAYINVWNFETDIVSGDITLYANWTINQYTITFDSNGGSDVGSITQDYRSTITPPAAPTKDGYTFAGWDPEVPKTMPAYNVNCVAKWTENPQPVPPSPSSRSYGASIWLPATAEPTAAPTEAQPTQAVPTASPVKPTPQASTPVPLAGIIAGLGAALVFGVRRK